MRWEGGEHNEDDIDNLYVRYEGEISDADKYRMVDRIQAGDSSGVDDDDINRIIDSMQVGAELMVINVVVAIPAQATSAVSAGAEGAAARGRSVSYSHAE